MSFACPNTSLTNRAQYDDLVAAPGDGILFPVGTYMGITYNNFIVADFFDPAVPFSGVIPHSDPNVALALQFAGVPTTHTLTAGPTTESFSLFSVYFGCDVATGEGFVTFAAACDITVTGFSAGSSTPVATQVFPYFPLEPVDLPNAPAFGVFSPDFVNLTSVTITVGTDYITFSFDNLVGSVTTF